MQTVWHGVVWLEDWQPQGGSALRRLAAEEAPDSLVRVVMVSVRFRSCARRDREVLWEKAIRLVSLFLLYGSGTVHAPSQRILPNGLCSPIEPSVSGPQLAVKLLREGQVMGVVGCPLLELGSQLPCPRVQAWRVVQFKPRPKQACNHPRAVLHLPPVGEGHWRSRTAEGTGGCGLCPGHPMIEVWRGPCRNRPLRPTI